MIDTLEKVASKPSSLKALSSAKAKLRVSGKPRLSNAMSPFGGVSQVAAAPVSIGNTLRSVGLSITRTDDGVIAVGRDFVQMVGGSIATFTNWTFQGGMALTPMALNASALRGYFQSHQQYRFRNVCAHYITSSPTSLSGDVIVMYHANHGGPKVNHTSNNFMAYALSTADAVLGPQWTNHSVQIKPKGNWLGTDVLNAEDVEHQADGEILIYTKNTTNGVAADSPGYFLIDYEVEFKSLMTNSRISTIPSSVFKWFPTGLFISLVLGAGDPIRMDVANATTYTATTGIVPPNTASGTIFQIVLDFQLATYAGITAANLSTMFAINQARNAAGAVTGSMVYPVDTGTTLYGVYRGTTLFDLYPNYPAVFSGSSLVATNALGAGNSVGAAAIMCAVGSINNVFLQANLG
jgi:hypothetical protein